MNKPGFIVKMVLVKVTIEERETMYLWQGKKATREQEEWVTMVYDRDDGEIVLFVGQLSGHWFIYDEPQDANQ